MARRCELTGKGVLSGNNVSHANNKTRRRYLPNLHTVTLFSDALKQGIRLRISANALRSVDKNGGVDSFLLAGNDEVLSPKAREWKRRIVRAAAKVAA